MKLKSLNTNKVLRINLSCVVGLTLFLILARVSCAPLRVAPADQIADNLSLTSADAPLPNGSYNGRLSFAYQAPDKMPARQRTTIHLLVKNASQVAWPCGSQPDGRYQIRVGNRWYDQNGNTIDDARGELPYDLRPGDLAEVLIVVTAPAIRGSYVLEFDLVQEQVTWFSEKGSETLRMGLVVE